MGNGKESIEYVEDRKGHDLRYSVDITKISKDLGYEPKVFWKQGLRETINWYQDNQNWWRPLKK
jgi:dTDP-glucose 4,6-dehydratase